MDSVVHHLDPRVKIFCAFFLVLLAVNGEQNALRFSLFFLILLSVVATSGISLLILFKKSSVIIPFVVLVAVFLPFFGGGERVEVFNIRLSIDGLRRFEDVVMKAFLSVLCMATLIETTDFPDLLKGLEKLKMPKIIVILISFTYRYSSLILAEANRMKTARDVRSTGGSLVWQFRTLGDILGQLFVRSYERSERIYQAMNLRGFTGEMKTLNTLRLSRVDVVCGVSFCTVVLAVRVMV